MFTKGLLAVLTSKDAVLKDVRDCIVQRDDQSCRDVKPYLHSFLSDLLHFRLGCVCVDARVGIPNSIQDPVLESLRLTHPESWYMITLGQYAFLPYFHWGILKEATKCKLCKEIGKNFKSIIPASKLHHLVS